MVQYKIPMTEKDKIAIATSKPGCHVGSCGQDYIITVPEDIPELEDFEIIEVKPKGRGKAKVDDDIDEILTPKGGRGSKKK